MTLPFGRICVSASASENGAAMAGDNAKRRYGDNGSKRRAPRKKKPVGRPCKLTPETQAKIIEALEKGAYQEVAARYAGIDRSQFYRWMEKGADPKADAKFRDFRNAVEKAETGVEVELTNLILQHAKKEWTAGATYLERKEYERWGRKDRIELIGASVERILGRVNAAIEQVAKARGDDRLAGEFADALRGSLVSKN